MKAQLQLERHAFCDWGDNVVEVHHDGRLLCVIYGADGPGIRIVSKHIKGPEDIAICFSEGSPGVVEVMIR